MKNVERVPIGRRVFMKRGAMAMMAMGLPPDFLLRPLLAETQGAAARKTLVCIFQRGAVDGLSMVVPFGDPAYARSRRATLIAAPSRGGPAGESAVDLDGFFALHPALSDLGDIYGRGELAIVHAVGSPHPTRSHFDAQDFMETATPGDKNTKSGWLNRTLEETSCAECSGRTLADGELHAADHAAGQIGMTSTVEALRGVAMGAAVPKSLEGPYPALAISDLAKFSADESAGGRDAFERIYRTDGGDAISSAADEAFEAARVLRSLDPAAYRAANGASYPTGAFGESLRQIAQLIKADVGVEIAFADIGGWDTHANQGGAQGTLARQLQQLSSGIAALHRDLGDRMDDVVILTMSEFGRTVAENGTGGTDHGHANCMLALGGQVNGGRVLGEWPGLEREQLYEGRDLALTTDFRDVFAELVQRHLGAEDLGRIFPGYEASESRFRGILRSV